MLVLLPPSEGKADPPGRGRPVDIDALSFPDLTPTRRRVLAALVQVCSRDDATRVLGLGPSLALEVVRNTLLENLPARPALEVYTGVLYDALDASTLDAAARRRAATRLLIASALWGWLRPRDRVPPYRLSMTTDLPGLGPVAAAWRPLLGQVLAQAAGRRGAIVDCRSAAYASAAPLVGDLADRAVAVRVLKESAGRRSVVSHMAKHTRGLVARELLHHGGDLAGPAEVAEVLRRRWHVELRPHQGPGRRPWALDVVIPE